MLTGRMLTGRKLALTLAFAGLLVLAFGSACRGFFVKSTLSTLTVTPTTQTIQTGTSGNTQRFTATGTDSDGNTENPAVTWTSSDTTVATISTTGLATSVSTGTSTITATANQNPTISGTASLTVTVGCIQSIAISPTSGSLANGGNTSVTLKATATTCNGTFDITATAIWKSSDTNIATVSAGVVTATGNSGGDGPVTISASAGNITSSPNAIITVSGY